MEHVDGEETLDSKPSAVRKLSLHSSTAANVTFRSRVRGFDRDEVRAFIGNLADDYERVLCDLERVKQELDIVQEKVSKPRPFPEATTRELEQILAGGAGIANKIRETAEQERQSLITATRSLAAGIIKAAEHRAAEIVERAAEITKAAEEGRERAEEECRSSVAAADSRAAEIVKAAEGRAGEIIEQAADASRASDEIREQAEKERRSIIDAAQSRGDEIVKDAERRAHEIIEHAAGQVALLGEQAERLRASFEVAATATANAMGTNDSLELFIPENGQSDGPRELPQVAPLGDTVAEPEAAPVDRQQGVARFAGGPTLVRR